jgi:hypothetical protein
MAANYEARYGNSYYFGDFADASTPIEADFGKPIKEIRIPLALELLTGSTPDKVTDISAGERIKFPNIGGYPGAFIFQGDASAECRIDVIEYGDVINADYFEPDIPE